MQQIDGSRQIQSATIANAQISATAAIANSKLATFSQDQDFGGFKATNAGTPTAGTDLATKAYVDGVAQGLSNKLSTRASSTATVAGTYGATGGTAARGQFTAMPNSIDGVSLAANDRVLLKDQSTPAQNGIWVVTTLGSGSNGVWDRATDFDNESKVPNDTFIFIQEGTSNSDTGWVLTNDGALVIGGGSSPTALAFVQFSGAGDIVAGNGLSKTGNTLAVVANGSTLNVGGSGVKVADAGVTETQLATSVAGGGLAGGAGTALSVDWSGLEAPSGSINGSNTAFTTAATPMGGSTDVTAVMVFLNGLLQKPTTDYTRSTTTITMVTAPATGDVLLVAYFKA